MPITYNEAGVQYSSSLYTYNGEPIGAIIEVGVVDSLGITDATSRLLYVTVYVSLQDSEQMADVIDFSTAVSRIVADTVGETDTISKSVMWGREIMEVEGATDSLVRAFEIYIRILDSVAFQDNLSVYLPAIRKSIVNMMELSNVRPQMSVLKGERQGSVSNTKGQITLQG